MYKKTFLMFIFIFIFFLAACGNNDNDNSKDNGDRTNGENNAAKTEQPDKSVAFGAPLQDGTYALNEANFDENGWKVQFTMVVDEGKITKSEYNYVNKNGDLKSDDDDYEKAMKDKAGVGPKEYIPDLNDQLTEKQDAKQVDVVTGATHSSEKFINYAQQLIQAAQAGNTATITIQNEQPLKDGNYRLAEKNYDENGWKAYINMTVQGGKVTDVDFNFLNEAGKLKTDDEEYEKAMKDKVGVGPQEYVPQLSDALVDKQDPMSIDVVSGATHSSRLFKMYAAQLVNAAEKGDITPIEVDNFVYEK